MQKIPTVNVVEVINNEVHNICSFNDNAEGNIEAERVFSHILKMNFCICKELIEQLIEDGYYRNNEYSVSLIHSC